MAKSCTAPPPVILARRSALGEPWVILDEPHVGTVDASYLIWRDVAPQLHHGSFRAVGAMVEAGNRLVVASGGFPCTLIRDCLDGVPALWVALHCSDAERERRLAKDPFRRPGHALRRPSSEVHADWIYDVEIDTDASLPSTIALELLDRIRAR